MKNRRRRTDREGTVAVECAFVLPVLLTLMFGVWEVGRLFEFQQILTNAAREGARAAAGGTINGTPVTVATVQQLTRDYMTAAGVPSAAVSGATITVTNLSGHAWTNPSDAQPLDDFSVTVTIPAGAPFDSLRWSLVNRITGVTQLTASVKWSSANDAKVVVSTSLPF